jgi:LPS-assembly lipoprotein
MWWSDRGPGRFRWPRLAAVLPLAAMTAGCFQPLYGERSFNGSPGLRASLAAVEVAQISAPPASALARMAVDVRNELAYALTLGESAAAPRHRLNVSLSSSSSSLIVDPDTARAEFELVNAEATYSLVDVASGKIVMTGSATAQTTYDVPGQQQRYTMLAGRQDAQSRAAKVIAEQIRNRLASYLAAGT